MSPEVLAVLALAAGFLLVAALVVGEGVLGAMERQGWITECPDCGGLHRSRALPQGLPLPVWYCPECGVLWGRYARLVRRVRPSAVAEEAPCYAYDAGARGYAGALLGWMRWIVEGCPAEGDDSGAEVAWIGEEDEEEEGDEPDEDGTDAGEEVYH